MPEPLLLSSVLGTRRVLVEPRHYPDELFASYSMPAFDGSHSPELVRGARLESTKFLASEGTILVSKLNPRIKRVWCVHPPAGLRALTSTEFVNVVPRRPEDLGFLFHLLSSNLVYGQLERVAEGTTNSHVRFRPGIIENLSLSEIAPAKSWQRVAEILTTADDAIEQSDALIAKMQQMKAGVMHDLFTRGLADDGRLRPTRDEAPKLYKPSPLGWIPDLLT